MIQILTHSDINKRKWDACIEHAQQRLPYAYSWVLDILHPHWQALVYNDYEAVMPLVSEKKMGLHLLRQSPWIQQLGVFSTYDISQSLYQNIFNKIPFKYRKYYIRTNYKNAHFNQSEAFETKLRINLILPLDKNFESLKSNFSSNTKRNIKKAEKYDLKIDRTVTVKALVKIYNTFQAPKHQFMEAKDYDCLPILLNSILEKKQGVIWGVRDEKNALITANFLWIFQDRIISLIPASTNVGRDKRGMFYLINELIKTYAQSDKILDFEGSNVESIARFNRGFGSVEQNYLELTKSLFPLNIRK